MQSKFPSEDTRYWLYRFGAHFCWWGATAWTAILTWVNLTRPVSALPNTFQRVSGLFILLLMGVGIALGSALSRMRLARTISNVFQVGMQVASRETTTTTTVRHVPVEYSDERQPVITSASDQS